MTSDAVPGRYFGPAHRAPGRRGDHRLGRRLPGRPGYRVLEERGRGGELLWRGAPLRAAYEYRDPRGAVPGMEVCRGPLPLSALSRLWIDSHLALLNFGEFA